MTTTGPAEEEETLTAEMDHETLLRLHVPRDPRRMLDARTWTALARGHDAPVPLTSLPAVAGDDRVHVSVLQREDGRHAFVALTEARTGRRPLTLMDEDAVRRVPRPRLFYATAAAAPAADLPTGWDHFDLAPHRGPWTNYTVLPWLCAGRTRAFVLSDEETLCRDQPDEPLLRHLALIVNCHQDRPEREYRAGSPWNGAPPRVVSHAVHKWYGAVLGGGKEDVLRKIDAVNADIWEALRTGTVAVHCLAGIHRAACIAACHFLYRRHVLGQKEVSGDTKDIYAKMMSVRPRVSPAYQHILVAYEAYLVRKTLQKTEKVSPSKSP